MWDSQSFCCVQKIFCTRHLNHLGCFLFELINMVFSQSRRGSQLVFQPQNTPSRAKLRYQLYSQLTWELHMALFDDIGKSFLPAALVGLGTAVVAPALLPALRPLAKAIIKSGIGIYDSVTEGIAETGEQLSDLMAEARAEMAEEAEAMAEKASEQVEVGRKVSRRKKPGTTKG
jgi:hypothetical protein